MLVAVASRWASVIAVYNTDASRVELYISEVMPFGATAAVYGFGRFAGALRKIGLRLFYPIWSNFFDDYNQIDLAVAKDASKTVAEKLA